MPPGAKACFDRLTQSRYVSADFSICSMEGETVMDSVEIVEADLDLGAHQKAVLDLVDAYDRDPMGNGGPLPDHVKDELIPGLKKHPTTLIFIAVVNREAVGIAVCFVGFSTFAARPLINVHDLAVLPGQRGSGVGRQLLAAVEEKARTMGCCKVTLEVLENNHRALKVYQAAGFARATYTEEAGGALFFAKHL
jgi:ribosomal protein S18 acetylase RimI-like enzyme